MPDHDAGISTPFNIRPLSDFLDLRHDLVLGPGLHQDSVHEQRHGGEAVLGPLPPLVKADPVCVRMHSHHKPSNSDGMRTDTVFQSPATGADLGGDQDDWLISADASLSLCAISYCGSG